MATRQPKPVVGAPQGQGRRQLPPSGGIRTEGPIAFQVHGLPIPQGSTRSWLVNGKPVITSKGRLTSSHHERGPPMASHAKDVFPRFRRVPGPPFRLVWFQRLDCRGNLLNVTIISHG